MYNLFLNMFAIWKQQVSIWISASKEIKSFFPVFSREIQFVMKCFAHNHTLIIMMHSYNVINVEHHYMKYKA